MNDGAGEYQAARVPVLDRGKIALFQTNIASRRSSRPSGASIRLLHGLPALVAEYDAASPGVAPRLVLQCEIDDRGAIRAVYTVLATQKLLGIRPVS